MNKLKTIILFINHVVFTLSLVRKNYLKIGRKSVLLTYLKICLQYLLVEIVLEKQIKRTVIFENEFEVPSFRLFITMYESVFIFDEYYFEARKRNPIIIDCGANIGMSVLYFKLLYPKSKIIVIEPHPIIYEILRKNVKVNNWKNTKTINNAVSNKARKINFYYNLKEPGSLTASTIESRVPKNRKSVVIKAIKLSSIFIKNTTIDFLKIDIEGDEEKVISEIYKSGEITKIQQAVIEYHHYLDPKQYRFSKLLNIIEKAKLNYIISTYKAYSPFVKDQYQDVLVYTYRG